VAKPEFIRRLQAANRKSRQYFIAGVTALGLCMIGAAALTSWKEHGGLSWTGSFDLWKVLLWVGLIVMVLSVLIAGAGNSGVPCVKCGKRLLGIAAQIAVATGNCEYCGEKAFDEMERNKPT
jgi:hypothetical protein